MLLITKRFAEAIVDEHVAQDGYGYYSCLHCPTGAWARHEIKHKEDCVVIAAERYLEHEHGVKPACEPAVELVESTDT